ncbi:unnamed protein product [Heligmosomoides polygyrus]|uniref:Uncharacterized protein n=1 Tax=Heligmosomoides polygyrus TaxID=6339 RepID=A0A183FJ59_HELPZ|nr:unnamed protein product [Heligmosomoides polygyrus]
MSSSSTMRPMSSLSSVSADSGIYTTHPPPLSSVPPPPASLPPSASRPPSPGLQITQLLHQTANLLAVNAQLRKEIEQILLDEHDIVGISLTVLCDTSPEIRFAGPLRVVERTKKEQAVVVAVVVVIQSRPLSFLFDDVQYYLQDNGGFRFGKCWCR